MSNPAYIQRQTQGDPGRLAPDHSPQHLRATAHLYGLATSPLADARVLVLGCGTAEGMLPFSLAHPRSRLVGIDISEQLIRSGIDIINRLKLDNIALHCQDYGSLDESLGQFDYIIATGLYSYLPSQTAEYLLDYCCRHLSPVGVLYVDYHIHPGAKAQEIVRDAVMLHAHSAKTDAELKASAQAVLTLFGDGVAGLNPMGTAVGVMARQLEAQLCASDGIGMPHPLANSACYFVEFADRATKAGLTYVGDSQPLSEIALNFGQGVSLSNSLLTLGQPAILKQQYLDFANGRGFRQSILTSQARATEILPRPDMARMQDLRWASGLQRLAGYRTDAGVTYVNHLGHGLTTADIATQAVVDSLAHVWPGSLSYANLLAMLAHRSDLDDPGARKALDRSLQTLLQHNVVHYCLDAGPYDTEPATLSDTVSFAPLLPFSGPQEGPTFNLWNEPVRLQLSDTQKALAASLVEEYFSAMAPSEIPASDRPTSCLQADPADTAELLNLLRRYALIRGKPAVWLKLLRKALDDSRGAAPYFGLYISAQARDALEAGIISHNVVSVPPPSLQSRANRMQEYMRHDDFWRAEPISRQLTQVAPGFIDAWEVLSASLFNTNRIHEALECSLHMEQQAPADFRSLVLLSVCLSRLGRTSEAISASRRAIELAPTSAHTHSALGDALNVELRFHEARQAYEAALVRDPLHRKSRLNLCKVLIEAGDIIAAERAAQDAVSLFPESVTAHSNLLFAANYSPGKSAKDVFRAYQECDKQLFLPLRSKWRPHRNSREANRKLKIGYVSPDFKKHSGNNFIEPLLANHDRQAFELTAYAELAIEDETTARFKTYFDKWVSTSGLNDADMSARIRSDKIDLLIDLAGHTQGNRLGVMARKPAPVSLTWMGYGYTTGLTAIDYIVTDSAMAPPGSEELFSENIWRLRSNFVYRAGPTMGAVNDLPALSKGYVTFGTLTRSIRINDRTIRVWAAILNRVPQAKLVINSGSYRDAAMCDALASRFEVFGVSRDRLDIGFHSPAWDVLAKIDIGLDCFPHNSGVTLIESVYMGVPYVSLADRPSVGRIGSSILMSIGHPEWICSTEEEYVEKAALLASDLPALSEVRKNLRLDMQQSALMSEAEFTKEFEDGLKEMYIRWCEADK